MAMMGQVPSESEQAGQVFCSNEWQLRRRQHIKYTRHQLYRSDSAHIPTLKRVFHKLSAIQECQYCQLCFGCTITNEQDQ